MQYADIVVPRGGQNRVAVQLIVEHVKDQLKQVLASPTPLSLVSKVHSLCSVVLTIDQSYWMVSGGRHSLSLPLSTSCPASLRSRPCTQSSGVVPLSDSTSLACYFLLIRNKDTKRDDFVFFTNRLACLAMEYTLSLLPFQVSLGPQ